MKTRLVQNGDRMAFMSHGLSNEIVIHRIGIRRTLRAPSLGDCEFLSERVR
jgi:hypothetical protein